MSEIIKSVVQENGNIFKTNQKQIIRDNNS